MCCHASQLILRQFWKKDNLVFWKGDNFVFSGSFFRDKNKVDTMHFPSALQEDGNWLIKLSPSYKQPMSVILQL
jgi:hypothetical protein